MKYKLEFLETKSPDWKIASISGGNLIGVVTDVSINKASKEGIPFPNFDTMMTGHDVEGDYWVSGAGKKYLFPPKKVSTTGSFTPKAGAITKAMETKSNMIEKAQNNKEIGIMTSSTIRMAVDIALAEQDQIPWDTGVFKSRIKFWRDWLIAEWDNVKDAPPFNG